MYNFDKTYIYIHVAVLGNFVGVLQNLISRIEGSDLYDAVKEIKFVVNGDISLIDTSKLRSKYNVIHLAPDAKEYEYPTLNMVWNDALRDEEITLLYLHTKGITHPGSKQVQDWTNYIAYFNINRWKERLNDLHIKKYDCSGTNLQGDHFYNTEKGETPLHYSGNFWWTKGSHLVTLHSPYAHKELLLAPYINNYINAEMWIASNKNGKYFNAFTSNVNHYLSEFPRELYESKI